MKDKLVENQVNLIERGGKLDELLLKANDLEVESKVYLKHTKKVVRQQKQRTW